jgi:hypothetical protein
LSATIGHVVSLMPTPNKCEQRFLGAFMGVTLKRGVVYQFDIADATWTATWTGEQDLEGTPIFAQLEDRCARVPRGATRGATWFGRLSEVAAVAGFAIGDGMVSSGNPYEI